MKAFGSIAERQTSGVRLACDRGQSMLEFVFAAMLAITIILGIIQIALVFNAHHMVQLAAFNAARAAIVTRNPNGNKPEDPTTLQEMRRKAKLAAFITLLPVVPDLHALMPTTLGATPKSIQDLLTLDPGNPALGGLPGGVARAAGVLMDYMLINVRFVRVEQDGDAKDMKESELRAMDPARGRVEFDDRKQADNNLIKVVVSWDYPLVIPFVNAIFFAAANPNRTAMLWLASHPEYAASHPITALEVMSGDPSVIPVWGLGVDYENLIHRTAGSGALADLARRKLYRVPVKASYIMRMQWDRMP